MSSPIICFGQQPCGIFPRRFLFAKFQTARRLQQEIGGEIVFFYHDSDHDPRETITILRDRHTGEERRLNFDFANKMQKLFSPLFAKRVLPEWQQKMARQLHQYVAAPLVEIFEQVKADNVADFCLQMYRAHGLDHGNANRALRRSGVPPPRERRSKITSSTSQHEGELVRARRDGDRLRLHKGGNAFIDLPLQPHDQDADQPDARHAPALDAVGDRLHALRRRRGRDPIFEQGRSAGRAIRHA